MEYILLFVLCLIGCCRSIHFSKGSDTTKRNLTSQFFCTDNAAELVYTRADSKHDSLHYLSSAAGTPVLLVARTDVKTTMAVHCDAFEKGENDSVTFTPNEPNYVFSIGFSKIFEFKDEKDKAKLDDKSVKDFNVIDLRDVTFDNITHTADLAKHTFTWAVTGGNNETLHLKKGGSLSFGIEIYKEEGRNEKLPHMLFNGNGSHIFFTLDKLKPSYETSRYALELQLVTRNNHGQSKKTAINLRKSLDDEHTPGVFYTVEWTVDEKESVNGAFVQWKPVCYTSHKPSIQHSTSVKNYEVVERKLNADEFSLAVAYFGANTTSSATNVSFGLSKDKFYNSVDFTEWTFVVGYGTPPEDEISSLIITIISVGLGIPIILLVAGSICACVKKRKDVQSDFTSSYAAIQ